MADQSDVLNMIVGKIAAIVYPNGTSSPSIVNTRIKVYPGWPVPNVLQKDIVAMQAHISVYPLPTERKISPTLGRPYYVIDAGNPTIRGDVSGSVITLSGAITTPQNLYFLINKVGYHYSVQSGDTLTSIATAMSAIIPNASNVGAVITIAGEHEVIFRSGGIGSAARELRRQEKDFQITIWSPTPDLRAQLGSSVDAILSENSNVSFTDGAPGTLLYSRSRDSDSSENYLCYRRDLIYSVNFATTQTISAPQVVAPVLNTNGISQNL